MNPLNWRAIITGSLVALVMTVVGFLLGLPPVGLFAGTAIGGYVAARQAGHHQMAHGAAVAVLMVGAAFVSLGVAYQVTTNVAVNGTTLVWAIVVLALGPASGFIARR